MDCTCARSLLHPWLDGELEREQHREVVEHLAACEPCDARFKDEQRLLARVKQGLQARCPAELRAKLVASIAAAPPPARGAVISFRRAAAAAAVLAVAFVWTDPICLRGCPTVRALAIEHRSPPAAVMTSTDVVAKIARDLVGEPVPECKVCPTCTGLECLGIRPLSCAQRGCMVFFKDGSGRSICFVKMKGAHVHAWLQLRAKDGLILTRQDGCCFAGWKDDDGDTCGLVADESVAPDELVALSSKVRGH